jgi:cell wall assembly regulator SMI1
MIELHNQRPPVGPADLEQAARALADLGHRIPPSYRGFLADQDGGEPVREEFSFEHGSRTETSSVQVFLGVAESPDGDLVSKARTLADRVPPGVLPIADDPLGNHICIDTRDGRDGPVLFWDHEYEGDPPDEANLYPIAPDLPTFLDRLREPEPLPAARKPKGLKRLFGRG